MAKPDRPLHPRPLGSSWVTTTTPVPAIKPNAGPPSTPPFVFRDAHLGTSWPSRQPSRFREERRMAMVVQLAGRGGLLADTPRSLARRGKPRLLQLPDRRRRPAAGASYYVLISAFVIVIGPLNYWLLRRKARLHLLLFTVPAAALVTSAGLIGYVLVTDGLTSRISCPQLYRDRPASARGRRRGTSVVLRRL